MFVPLLKNESSLGHSVTSEPGPERSFDHTTARSRPGSDMRFAKRDKRRGKEKKRKVEETAIVCDRISKLSRV